MITTGAHRLQTAPTKHSVTREQDRDQHNQAQALDRASSSTLKQALEAENIAASKSLTGMAVARLKRDLPDKEREDAMVESMIGFGKTLQHIEFEDALGRVTQALATEGFGVLTEIDVQATLKKKLDVDFKRYRILGACNPSLAHRALLAAPHVGLLLPCNVVVQEVREGVEVMIADPKAMFSLVREPSLEPVVSEAEQRLRRALDSLG